MWVRPLTKGHRAALMARLGELPTAERQPLVTNARRKTKRDRRARIPAYLAPVAVWAGGIVGFICANGPGSWRTGAIMAGMTGMVAFAGWAGLIHSRLTDRALAAEFPTLCPGCGYDRRATPARCPECGTESFAGATD